VTAARLIVDPPQAGAWNMAVDEALLHSAAAGVITLRFYQWSEPTLSLGYFQAAAERESHAASRSCPLVRRASGGGAILHHHELTYSFAAPVSGRFPAAFRQLYLAFHQSLIEALEVLGLRLRLGGNKAECGSAFLCFSRRTPFDVLLDEGKICGSAQRRFRGAVLQHGSVVLRTSPFAPEIAGMDALGGVTPEPDWLVEGWISRLEPRLGLSVSEAELTPAEAAFSGEVATMRFACDQWTYRR
jgi:lipoate-protein ligase A